MEDSTESSQWLLLIHQLPPKPDYLRVKVRRRLRRLGARPLRGSVYVLPDSEEAREDFQWLLGEIRALGGEAILCRAAFLDGLAEEDLQSMFASSPDLPGREAVPPGSTWVTRRDVHVDRMASAWLIKREIDPEARFKFVAPRGYQPEPGELRFDMYRAEYTHEGAACSFEVLLRRFAVSDPALQAIAEIVHDLDCKDAQFDRPETAGVAAMLAGIVAAESDDHARLARSAPLFESLARHFAAPRL